MGFMGLSETYLIFWKFIEELMVRSTMITHLIIIQQKWNSILSGGWVQAGPIKGGERLQVRDDRHAFMTVVLESLEI
jgi:hypothetical protein